MPVNILVGDIGSTKSLWLSNSAGSREYLLPGYNPVSHIREAGLHMLDQLAKATAGANFSRIYYYGSGIVDENIATMIGEEIRSFFPDAKIMVASDLLGAAKAACKHSAGTIAILGTGSHGAVYDGVKITKQASSLGYILGDEGGGCDLGKQLVKAYFYKQLPDPIFRQMKQEIGLERGEFLHQLYTSRTPNQFLADYVRVAVDFIEDDWIQKMIKSRFSLFIQNHILPLEPEGPIQVVGSIGSIFAGLFQEVLAMEGLTAGEFVKNPARKLFEMHLQHE